MQERNIYLRLGPKYFLDFGKTLKFLIYLIFFVCMFLFQDSHDQTTYMIYYGLGAVVFFLSIFKIYRLKRLNVAFCAYIAFVSYATLSLFWGPSFQIPQFKIFIFGAAMFVAFYIELSTKKDCEQFTRIIFYASIVLSVYFLVNMSVSEIGPGRTTVEGLNVINAGVVSSVGAVTAVYLAIKKKQKRYYLILIIYYLVVLMSGSKLAIFASVFMPLCFIFFCSRYLSKKIGIILLAIALIAIGYIFLMNNSFLYNSIGYRIEGFIRMIFYGEEGEDSARIIMIDKGLELFKEKPIFGVGFDCYRILNGWTKTWSHCNYIEILSCFGIVGFLLYYSRFILCFVAIKKSMNNANTHLEIAYVKSLIICIVIMEIGIVTMHAAIYQVLFALICRMGMIYNENYIEDKK